MFERELGVTLPDGMKVHASDNGGVSVELPDNVEALLGDEELQLSMGVLAGYSDGAAGYPVL